MCAFTRETTDNWRRFVQRLENLLPWTMACGFVRVRKRVEEKLLITVTRTTSLNRLVSLAVNSLVVRAHERNREQS